jgi:hypothetical protein
VNQHPPLGPQIKRSNWWWWETTTNSSKPPRPIIMIDQSETHPGISSQIIFITLFSGK